MRIAFFTDTYLPKFDGVTSVVDSWSSLMARNNEVKVFAPAYSRDRYSETRNGFVVERFESLALPASDRLHFVIPDFMGEISDVIERFRPDVIHLHSLGLLGLIATRIAQKKKIPLVGTYHSLLSEMIVNYPPFDNLAHFLEPENGEEGILRKFAWGLTKVIYAKCDLIVSPAIAIKKDLRHHGFKNWIEVVSNGINLEKFSYSKKENLINNIIHVGRLSAEKHVDMVIKAMKMVVETNSDVRMTIVGDGMEMSNIQRQVKELGLHNKVKLVGYVSRENLNKYYANADLFVTASTMEVQPMVILEAMSTGLPVIAVNKAGIVGGDVRNNYNGMLVSEQNSGLLAEKILNVYSDTKKWRRLSENARKTAEKNSVVKSVDKMEKLYRKLLN